MAEQTLTVIGIAGSLRESSLNRGLLRAAQELAPEGMTIELADIRDIPPFDADVEAQGDPPSVQRLKDRIRQANALLIATPEYNYSIPGVLKNAIDWVSRPPNTGALRRKPAAIMGASPTPSGTMRAQLALRQVFTFTETLVLPKPELYMPRAADLFDDKGNLQDESARKRVRELLEALDVWTRTVQPE